MSEERLARVRDHLTEAAIVELTFIIGYETFSSKFAEARRLAPQGFSSTAGSWNFGIHPAASTPFVGT